MSENSDDEVENKIVIPMSTSKLKSKFRFQHHNFDEIRMEFRRNFDFVEVNDRNRNKIEFRFCRSKRSKPKQNRNCDFDIKIEISKNRIIEISTKVGQNFVGITISSKVKLNYYRGNPSVGRGLIVTQFKKIPNHRRNITFFLSWVKKILTWLLFSMQITKKNV
jgi:hypothetical protein